MKRWYKFLQVSVLTWALHRLARAVFGFPLFSFSEFKLGEFVVDLGVYSLAFAFSYWFFIYRTERSKDQRR